MGVIFTESWQRYAAQSMAGAYTAENITIKDVWPMKAVYGTTTTNVLSFSATVNPGMAIVADPILPSKRRFAFMGDARSFDTSKGAIMLQRNFDAPINHYFVGFLSRIPAGNKTPGTTGTTNIAKALTFTVRNAVRRVAGLANIQSFLPAEASAVFGYTDSRTGVTGDVIQGNGSAGNIPPRYAAHNVYLDQVKTLAYDTDYFFEIEVDVTNQKVNVWCDDFLVAQPAWTTPMADLANGFEFWFSQGGGTSGGNGNLINAGDVYLSDIYIVDATDNIEPTGRLGSTTRVLGVSPNADIEAEFTRPEGFASNAELVGAPVSTYTPSAFLAGDAVDTQDIYALDTGIASVAAKVYAVTVRAKYANGASTPHELSAILSDGTAQQEKGLGALPPMSGYVSRTAVFNKDANGNAWTPQTAENVQAGIKIIS